MKNIASKTLYIVALTAFYGCISKHYSSTIIINTDYKTAYQNARNSGDYYLAITYMNLLANYSKDSIQYYDSLSNLYFNTRYFNQSIYWSKRALKYNDSNVFALSIIGRSYQRNSDFITSISYLEKLIAIENKPENYLYLAESQYRVKRLLECIQTSLQAEKIPDNYDYNYSYADSLGNKKISNVKAALINFRGLSFYELGEYEQAQKTFEEALLFDPEFVLARFNLQIVKEKIKKNK